jgi:hypothetical protein
MTITLAPEQRLEIHAAIPGLALAVLTVLFGFGLGIVFGLDEGVVKSRFAASAAAVEQTVYGGDSLAAKPVLDKSWSYAQRAHLHAGSLGTSAIALTVALLLVGTGPGLTRVLSLAFGIGGLGYSVFWLLAGLRAPGLGSTGAAKESLAWLAIPSSGLFVAATVVVLILCLRAVARGSSGSPR